MNPLLPIGISIFFGLLSPVISVVGMMLASRGENARAQAAFAEQINGLRNLLTKIETKNDTLSERVQEALMAKAVTAQQLDTLSSEGKRLETWIARVEAALAAGFASDTKARHDLREELHSMFREMERRLEERIDHRHAPHPQHA